MEGELHIGFAQLMLPELIEAAVHLGERALAEVALAQLVEATQVSGTVWAVGTEACCRAMLVDDGEEADSLYQWAIEQLDRCRMGSTVPRARLLYGERPRRTRPTRARPRSVRGDGAQRGSPSGLAWSYSPQGHARKRVEHTRDVLTPQELQVATLAAAGATTQEVASHLFISRSTVAYHLAKVFRKLDIQSRQQLAAALDAVDAE